MAKIFPLTASLKERLPTVINFIRGIVEREGRWATREEVRRFARCSQDAAHLLLQHVKAGKLVGEPKAPNPDDPSKYDLQLVEKAVPYFREVIEKEHRLPTKQQVQDFLRCGQGNASYVYRYIIQKKLVDVPPEMNLKEKSEMTESTWEISLPRTRIHTLEELLKFFKVDPKVWEVERFIANKWEMGYKDAKDEAHTVPLYQVKAFLRRIRFTVLEDAVKDNARLRSQLEKLRLDVKSERGLVQRLARNHAGYDDVLVNIKELVGILGDLQLPKEKVIPNFHRVMPAVSRDHTEDAVLLLSDEHFGDVIRGEDTSGFPLYDLIIAGNRMGYIIQKAKQILSIHRAAYPIKRLYVWMGGDVGNGILHDSPNSNALFPPAQVHFGYHMLKFAIEDLLTLTEPDERGVKTIQEIVLLFSVGNHMRMDEKMPHKYQAQRTLDWLIYQFLMERFAKHPKILIHETMSPFIFETIRGHRHLFCHGMQVGYRNSPDVQNRSIARFLSLTRALFDSPEWRQKNGLQNETFSRAVVGDIHIPIRYPRFISNGSLNGQNELGVNWALEPIPAGQWLWGVTEEHQETWHYFLECSKVQRTKKDMNNYGVFADEYMKRVGRGGETLG